MPSGKVVVEIARGGGLMVMVGVANLVVSGTEVAVTIVLTELATLAGASYWTEVPDRLLKAPRPERLQVTPFPDESFETVTVRVLDWPCKMVCELPPIKLIEIGGGGGLMVMVAVANLVVSAAEVAVTMALTVVATLAGASYWKIGRASCRER